MPEKGSRGNETEEKHLWNGDKILTQVLLYCVNTHVHTHRERDGEREVFSILWLMPSLGSFPTLNASLITT